ncbi:Hypothetical protein PHPALM_20743 [Phytophthora palmivora]|uniref:Uncharacterized protein n=1 Tax=Phytophthora palmivora TaxID=4796 RepID=A0A2P4XE37_9STRA|nr:Hypothetical protein PHPALM_20743 [Phytophthora palmivora]
MVPPGLHLNGPPAAVTSASVSIPPAYRGCTRDIVLAMTRQEAINQTRQRILAFSSTGHEVNDTTEEMALHNNEKSTYFPKVDTNPDRQTAAEAEWRIFLELVKEAGAQGCSNNFASGLTSLLRKSRDVFL